MSELALPWLVCVLMVSIVETLPQNIDNIDTSQLPHQDINTLNCFGLVEEGQWAGIQRLDIAGGTLSVVVSGAGQPVVTCLGRQSVRYMVSVVGDPDSQKYLLGDIHSWEGGGTDLVSTPPTFHYLIYPGKYRLKLTHCGAGSEDQCTGADSSTVFSSWLAVEPLVNSDQCSPSLSSNTSLVSLDTGTSAVFQFTFSPCTLMLDYDTANVSLHSSTDPDTCGGGQALVSDQVGVNSSGQLASVEYQSPELPAESFYCLSVSLSHISCRLAAVQAPSYCYLHSEPVWLPQSPLISHIIPFCTDHLACGWLYIVIGAGSCLVISCVLAICCVRCCDHCSYADSSRKQDEIDFSGDVVSLAPLHEKISWAELHREWDSKEDKVRGKILLLFSPDTKLFKELQEAFKSFLDLACHCDIYDLFDDALFDTIALDPSEWLQEFVNDEDVKILVISSAGAHRRQLAVKGEQPLNLPDNSLLDGLFTSGLRFVSTWPGVNSGRVATARYEMLHLTDESHKLGPPLAGPGVREFLVPTQLHELFCWIHHLKPLDLIGKPWANYHLEMQLLQDALKLVRRDRSNQVPVQNVSVNYKDIGNGVTMI